MLTFQVTLQLLINNNVRANINTCLILTFFGFDIIELFLLQPKIFYTDLGKTKNLIMEIISNFHSIII